MPKRSTKSDDPIISAKRVLDRVIAKHGPESVSTTKSTAKQEAANDPLPDQGSSVCDDDAQAQPAKPTKARDLLVPSPDLMTVRQSEGSGCVDDGDDEE
jgi:hypothetical protein